MEYILLLIILIGVVVISLRNHLKSRKIQKSSMKKYNRK